MRKINALFLAIPLSVLALSACGNTGSSPEDAWKNIEIEKYGKVRLTNDL